ncbi:thiol-disulfide isomerase-like thioredoxin [Echinicola vietnamensis DSM 17526]|uniref:Thiol-disulfide isomerase-like thioredoxin n=2 Tax=Echinicola TaxID=390846 RepID=L0FWS3_ECHVK|nr:thiol-disulfide isomerase-like thioredoxin [Echinicola vietnamensis DSM 17526]
MVVARQNQPVYCSRSLLFTEMVCFFGISYDEYFYSKPKYFMKSTFYLLPLMALLACGKAEQGPAVKLTLHLENPNKTANIEVYDMSEQLGHDLFNPVASFPPDSAGIYTITLDSVDFGIYMLAVDGKELSDVVLYDGINMQIKGTIEKPEELVFSGKGAGENQFFTDFKALPPSGMNEIVELEKAEFIQKLDSSYQAGIHQIKKADSLNTAFLQLGETLLKARRGMYASYYPIGRSRFSEEEEIVLPDSINAYATDAIAVAENGLKTAEYRSIVSNFNRWHFNDAYKKYTEAHPDEEIGLKKYMEMKRDFILEEEDDALQEYLLAQLSLDAINYYGDEAVALVYDIYQEKYPDSQFKAYLEAVNKKWEKLAKGKPAKEVEGTAPDGSKVKLSDFEGKVVYLDTWATWCGPCRGEFPAAKVLKEEYKDQEDLIFMYASIDSDKDAWEKFLENDPEFKGVHLYMDGAWQSDLCNDYMIRAIPRYILIDKNGNIANVKAPRPSSGEDIRNEINALL